MMHPNPFIRLFEAPVETLNAAAYTLVLLSFIFATWYAAGRNTLAIYEDFQNGWQVLPTFWWTLRVFGLFWIAAIDLLLVAGIVHTIA